ncbi:MAG TPA: type 4a pilus biogenesis protein PilO [Actinoplanes sp.]|nr:type 4a pilus biogenesis protein PilO [Actinoplanes sp.]
MGIRHADRLWMVGGVIATALLIAVSWFLLISPQRTQIDEFRAQQETTETQLVVLKRRLSELEDENKKLPQYRATLKRNQQALPVDSGVPDFLRQLQDSGELAGITVTGLTVNAPEQVTGTNVYSLPINVTAEGTADELHRFLDQVQQVQPRAVLIGSAGMASGADSETSGAGTPLTMTLDLKAFVAPEAGAGTPATAAPNK